MCRGRQICQGSMIDSHKIPDVTSVGKIEAIQFIITYEISDFGLLMISKYQFWRKFKVSQSEMWHFKCLFPMIVVWYDSILYSPSHVPYERRTLFDRRFSLNFQSQFWGCIWKSGYEKGTLKGELFDDSLPYFEKLITNGDLIGIYSSGSIQAQKFLLEYSQHGNIAKLFRQRFNKLNLQN